MKTPRDILGVNAHLVAAVVISLVAFGFSLAAFSLSLVALLR